MISTDKNVLHREFPVAGPVTVSVRLGQGSVRVHAEPQRTTAVVEIRARDGERDSADQVTVSLSGDVLSVHGPRQGGLFELVSERRRLLAVDAVIRVPAASTLRAATFTADVTATGEFAAADLATGTAHIEVERVTGDLRLRTGAASSQFGTVGGDAVIRSGAGGVTLQEVRGSLEAVWGGGRLEVGDCAGPVRARTGAGTIHLGRVHADTDLQSGSGRVEVGLPAGVTARADARTGHGSVSSDIPVEDTPREGAAVITLRARTGSGDVRIFRAG